MQRNGQFGHSIYSILPYVREREVKRLPGLMLRELIVGVTVGCIVGFSGCTQGPRAPAIQDETVYRNSQEGFHFVPPENWKQQARAEFPAGPVPQKRLLVEYRCFTSEKPASLDVSMVDVSEARSLAECVREQGVEDDWPPAGPIEDLKVGGRAAARGIFATRAGGEPRLREIVAVRKGGRVYLFTAVFAPSDTRSKEAVRNAVATLTW